MATTLNISALPDYVNQNREQLFVEATVGARTLDFVEIYPNVKYKEALHYLDSDVEIREASCGWNPGGSDTFGERYVEVKTAEIEKEYCYLDFSKKYMNYQLNFEAGRENLPFEEKIANSNVEAVKEAVENGIWQGISGITNGFLAELGEVSAATVEFASGETVTGKIDDIVAACTSKMLAEGVNIFMSYTDFRNYVRELNATCCANRPMVDAASEELTYAGDSRIRLIPVLGLEGTGAIVASVPDGLVYATDIEGAETAYDMWFDKDEQKMKLRILWNIGVAVKFPNKVVLGKDAE